MDLTSCILRLSELSRETGPESGAPSRGVVYELVRCVQRCRCAPASTRINPGPHARQTVGNKNVGVLGSVT